MTNLTNLYYIDHIIMIIFLHVFTNPSTQSGCDTRSIFYAELKRFEFRVVFLLYWLPYHGERAQSALLFHPQLEEE